MPFFGGRRGGVFFTFRVDEFVEIAHLTVCSLFLVQEFQVVFIELPEEFVPGNFPQAVIIPVARFRKLETEDARFVVPLRPLYLAGNGVARLGPLANFVMIFRGL
jgi:hypothetical protein